MCVSVLAFILALYLNLYVSQVYYKVRFVCFRTDRGDDWAEQNNYASGAAIQNLYMTYGAWLSKPTRSRNTEL